MTGLAEALVAVHAAGVVHRDLKPSNVILSPSGPKLVDFGIARALDGTSVTRSGVLVGTPGWVSPEEYRGAAAEAAADVYGWAMLAVYAATGHPPYGTARPEVLALRVLNDPVDTSAVPGPLRGLVDKALAKDPRSRPSIQEILTAASQAWRIDGVEELTARLGRTWVLAITEPSWPNHSGSGNESGGGSGRRTVMAYVAAATVLGVGAAAAFPVLSRQAAPSTPATAATSSAPRSSQQGFAPSTSSTKPSPSLATPVSTSPSAPARPALPRTTAELAAALDLALEATPAANFTFEGGFTQSDTGATKATGRMVNRTGQDDLDVQVPHDDSKADHVIVSGGNLSPGKEELSDLQPGTPKWIALMVASTAGPSIIGEVVANSTRMEHKGRTYSGALAIDKTNGHLREFLSSWVDGDVAETTPDSYLTYRLSLDSGSRPKSFRLVWCVPMSGGIYRSEFSTAYSHWRSNGTIDVP